MSTLAALLNAEIERGYDIGLSDNRTFNIIGNDGGLLNAPVAVNRVKLMPGERVEILINPLNTSQYWQFFRNLSGYCLFPINIAGSFDTRHNCNLYHFVGVPNL